MVVPCLSSLFYFVWFSDEPLARVVYGATKLFTLVWPVIATLWILGATWPRLRLTDRRHLRAIPAGLLTGGAIVALMFALMLTPLGDVVRGSSGAIRSKAEALGILEHYWLFAIFLSLIHSLIEEYYWRWFVFGRLAEAVPVAAAHGLAGVAFAAHHVVVATQFFPLGWGVALGASVGLGGIIWSVLYRRQGTLAGAWVSHIIVDLGIMAVGHHLLLSHSG
jgi:uncharacterized protein